MGFSGDILITIMMLLAVTSTASAEVVAVTSILVYDVYQLYLKVSVHNRMGLRLFVTGVGKSGRGLPKTMDR